MDEKLKEVKEILERKVNATITMDRDLREMPLIITFGIQGVMSGNIKVAVDPIFVERFGAEAIADCTLRELADYIHNMIFKREG